MNAIRVASGSRSTQAGSALMRIPPLVVAASSGALLALTGLLWFQSSGTDDAYITFAAAEATARHGSVVNYSGEPVEQSSSLGSVLLLAAWVRLTGLGAPSFGFWLGLFAAMAIPPALLLLFDEEERSRSLPALLWIGLCGYLAHAALTGMETTLYALALVMWVASHGRALRSPKESRPMLYAGLCSLWLLSLRPEAPLLVSSSLAAAVFVTFRQQTRAERLRCGSLLLVNLSCMLLLMSWRWFHFGSVFPQPVYAKGPDSLGHAIALGFAYVRDALGLGFLWLGTSVRVAQLAAPWRVRAVPFLDALACSTVGAGLCFVILVGGDWMEGARFLAPLVPLAAYASARALAEIRLPARAAAAVTALGALAMAASGPALAKERSTGVVAWADIERADTAEFTSRPFYERRNRVHVRDVPLSNRLPELVRRLARIKGSRVWVLTGQGGMTLYYTWRHNHESLGVIDRYGLMDRYLGASPTALLPGKTRWGLRRRYDYLMQNLEQIRVECGMPEPDVVYDLVFDERERGALEQRGFMPVFIQGGFVRSSEPRFRGRHLSGRAVVFVQRRYLEALGPEYRWTFAF